MIDFGWHLVKQQWLLGSRPERAGTVVDPQAVIEKRAGKWYWRTFDSDAWHACDSFSEAQAAASIVLKNLASQQG